jgi:uncharacterized protein DUF417
MLEMFSQLSPDRMSTTSSLRQFTLCAPTPWRAAMNRLVNKTVSVNGIESTASHSVARRLSELLAYALAKLGLLRDDAEYHLLRAAMVTIFFFFGYQKWFAYEVDRLIPFISNGPLIFWLSGFWHARRHAVLGDLGMDFWHAAVPWILA